MCLNYIFQNGLNFLLPTMTQLFFISLVIFACGFIFIEPSNQEDYLKAGGIGVFFIILIQLFISYHMLNPSSTVNYQGVLVNKDHRITTRTESYSCGNNQTCTRTVTEDHYYLIIQIFDDIKKEEEVDFFTYLNAEINSPYTYVDSITNFYLFKKDAFDTSSDVLSQYKDKIPKRPSVLDLGKYNRVVNLDKFGNVEKFKTILEQKITQYLMKKPYDFKIVITNEDFGFYNAFIDEWDGAAPTELIMVYGVDEHGEIQWNKLETFAQNDSNQKLVADFTTKHMGDKDKISEQLILEDMDFILQNYHAVSNDEQRFVDLQKTASKMPVNITLVISVVLQVLLIVFLSRQW